MSDYDPPFHPDHDADPALVGDDGEGIYVPPQPDHESQVEAVAVHSWEHSGDPAEHRHEGDERSAEHPSEHVDEHAQGGHQGGPESAPERQVEGSGDSPAAHFGGGGDRADSSPDLSALTNAGRHAVESASAPQTVLETAAPATPAEPVEAPRSDPEPTSESVAAEPVESPRGDPEPASQSVAAEPVSAPSPGPDSAPQNRPARAKKPGPKPMTDEPTVRIEGQLYVAQQTAGMATLARLKIENKSTPSAERRRLSINTLIRIGMTIVLDHADDLHGKTEDELLASLRAALGTDSEGVER